MTTRELFEKAVENWQIKVVCFVAALLLYVGHTFNHLEKKTFTVPLEVSSKGAVCPTSGAPDFVKVTIRSTQENIAEVLMSDLSATLDLTYLSSDGEYLVPVTVKLSPKVLMMDSFEVRMSPERVPMRVETKVTKYMEVKPSVVGEAAHGYTITGTTSDPSYIQVSGPKSAVNAMDCIRTEMVDVTDLMFSEDFETPYMSVNSLVAMKKDSDTCTIHVEVTPETMTRTFLGVPVKVLNLSSSLELVADILPITFDAEGTVTALENFTLRDNAVTINCSGIKAPGSYNLPVRISLPYPLKLQSSSADTVRVTVREKAVPSAASTEKSEGAA